MDSQFFTNQYVYQILGRIYKLHANSMHPQIFFYDVLCRQVHAYGYHFYAAYSLLLRASSSKETTHAMVVRVGKGAHLIGFPLYWLIIRT